MDLSTIGDLEVRGSTFLSGNDPGSVRHVWVVRGAVLRFDRLDPGEGILALPMPLVGADWDRVQSLRPYAEQLAKVSGKKIKLVKFSQREELEELG